MNKPSSRSERTQNSAVKPVLSSPPMFDHERLDVYHLELQFISCAACLDALVAKQAVTEAQIVEGKKMLVRIVPMCGLIERFDQHSELREDTTIVDAPREPVSYGRKQSRTRTRTRTRRKI